MWNESISIQEAWFDHHSRLHGRLHTLRVMYWTACITERMMETADASGYTAQSVENIFTAGTLAFRAAVIHDCARQHDGRCLDHGIRASQSKKWILEEFIYKGSIPENEWAVIERALIMHCRKEGNLSGSLSDLALAILKDADGLDRVRLGDGEPNPSFLRISFTPQCIPSARRLLDWTSNRGADLDWKDLWAV